MAQCLRDYGEGTCDGAVEVRTCESSTSASGYKGRELCEFHFQQHLDFQEETRRKYPVNAPSSFDPAYAGERWEEGG